MKMCVMVGSQVVGGFDTKKGIERCMKQLAPGCKAKVKKMPLYFITRRAAKYRSNEVRSRINKSYLYQRYSRMLKPGDFKV